MLGNHQHRPGGKDGSKDKAVPILRTALRLVLAPSDWAWLRQLFHVHGVAVRGVAGGCRTGQPPCCYGKIPWEGNLLKIDIQGLHT